MLRRGCGANILQNRLLGIFTGEGCREAAKGLRTVGLESHRHVLSGRPNDLVAIIRPGVAKISECSLKV